MRRWKSGTITAAMMLAILSVNATGQANKKAGALTTTGIDVVNGKIEIINYRGRPALHLVPLPGKENGDDGMMAVLSTTDFQDGTIEADVAGAPRAGAAPTMRGFIGIAFRTDDGHSEIFY